LGLGFCGKTSMLCAESQHNTTQFRDRTLLHQILVLDIHGRRISRIPETRPWFYVSHRARPCTRMPGLSRCGLSSAETQPKNHRLPYSGYMYSKVLNQKRHLSTSECKSTPRSVQPEDLEDSSTTLNQQLSPSADMQSMQSTPHARSRRSTAIT
jgi:hypothetical protein